MITVAQTIVNENAVSERAVSGINSTTAPIVALAAVSHQRVCLLMLAACAGVCACVYVCEMFQIYNYKNDII